VSRPILLAIVPLALVLTGCGSKKAQAPTSTPATTAPGVSSTAPTTTSSGATALQAEANAAATGDIPDNQIFLTFKASGFTLKYPEGWAQSGSGSKLTFRDKNNIIRVVVVKGAKPTAASVRHDVSVLHGVKITSPPKSIPIGSAAAIHVVYETHSAPNAVTGKTVTLGVDRYYLSKGNRVAIVDLGSPVKPVKVDNVDAYRLIIHSFRWR
jgi:hypothetical protein